MLLSYQECLEKYGTDYKIKKCVQEGELYVKEKGIYSDKRYVPELEIISKKYPNAIITPVSYTHLTLATILRVEISVVDVSL